MPRPLRVPSYCRHKASDQAVARIGCCDHYLGPYGSSESHERYERLISEWRITRAQKPAPRLTPSVPAARAFSVSE